MSLAVAFWIACAFIIGGNIGLIVGFLLGDWSGTKDTERRWSDAVKSSNAARGWNTSDASGP